MKPPACISSYIIHSIDTIQARIRAKATQLSLSGKGVLSFPLGVFPELSEGTPLPKRCYKLHTHTTSHLARFWFQYDYAYASRLWHNVKLEGAFT